MALPLAAFGALSGTGHFLSQTHAQDANFNKISRHELPQNVQQDYTRHVARKMDSSVLPSDKALNRPHVGHYSQLSGRYIPSEEFTHNNMTPHYGSKVKQDINLDRTNPLLENFTGTGSLGANKQEQKSLYDMAVGSGTAGMQNNNAFFQSRMNGSKMQTSVFPIEPIRVGPGLGEGYTAQPSGGLQQSKTLDYVRPKTLEELRAGSNVKQTMMARHNEGVDTRNLQRAVVPVPENRAPKVSQEQSADRMIPQGTTRREAQTGEIFMRDVERGLENYYVPPPMKATAKMAQCYDSEVTKFRDDAQEVDHTGVPTMAHMMNPDEDYGASNIELGVTSKEMLMSAGRPGNLVGLVKSLISPITDALKLKSTKKELYVNQTHTGNVGVAFPDKLTVKPPDVAKTTLKETQLHCTPNTNLKGATKTTVYDPSHKTKTTMKELGIHDTRIGNLNPREKCVYQYNAQEHARTTQRETLGKVSTTVNLKGHTKGRTRDGNAAKVSIRETTISAGRKGGAFANNGQGYQIANVNAKHTNKQFLENNKHLGIADGNSVGAYQIQEIEVPITGKDILVDNEHFGVASSANFKRERKDVENMSINESKESINLGIHGYMPTPQGVKEIPNSDGVVLTQNFARQIENDERPSVNKVTQIIPDIGNQGVLTHQKEFYTANDRLDVAMTQVLQNNPYHVKN